MSALHYPFERMMPAFGDTMEVAAILGNIAKEGDDDIISAVTDMLKNAEKMPKK